MAQGAFQAAVVARVLQRDRAVGGQAAEDQALAVGVGEGLDDLRPFSARDYVDALFD